MYFHVVEVWNVVVTVLDLDCGALVVPPLVSLVLVLPWFSS
jgi:hypothetical protein